MRAFVRSNWDRVAALVLVLLGGVAIVLGWFGVSGTGLAAEQNPYLISGGLAGIALIAVGCTLWLSSDLQDEWRRLDALEARLGELHAGEATASVAVDLDEAEAAAVAPRRAPRRAPLSNVRVPAESR